MDYAEVELLNEVLDSGETYPTEPESYDDTEAPKMAQFRAFPKVTATKDNLKKWGIKGTSPTLHKTILFMREAPYISSLNRKLSIIANEYPNVGNLTAAINACFCIAIDLAYDELGDMRGYKDAYLNGEEIPETWLDVILTEKAAKSKLEVKKFTEDIANVWLPEYKRLGHEEFVKTYGQLSNIADILEQCRKEAPLSAMVQTDAGFTLTAKILQYLKELAQTETIMRFVDIESALIAEGILPDKSEPEEFNKAKSVLRFIGSKNKLSGKEVATHGYWNLSPLNEN